MAEPQAHPAIVQKDPLSRLPKDVKCVRKVRRAAGIAGFNAVSFAVLAVASANLILATMFSGGLTVAAVGITVVLGLVAYYEYRGRKLLQHLDVKGCSLLGWNQLGLLAALVLYCGWSIVWGFMYPTGLTDGINEVLAERPEILEPYSEQEQRDLKELIEIMGEFGPVIMATTYGAIIVASVLYQGWNAWYYFSRKKFVKECQAMSESGT